MIVRHYKLFLLGSRAIFGCEIDTPRARTQPKKSLNTRWVRIGSCLGPHTRHSSREEWKLGCVWVNNKKATLCTTAQPETERPCTSRLTKCSLQWWWWRKWWESWTSINQRNMMSSINLISVAALISSSNAQFVNPHANVWEANAARILSQSFSRTEGWIWRGLA